MDPARRAVLRRAMLCSPIVNAVADAMIAELPPPERDALPDGWLVA
ncbi:MAG: hypothetical protein KGY99_08990 [Phycisphaerae bacterium]|nr:hypothetical protein [Phycisphaerae bacterium]